MKVLNVCPSIHGQSRGAERFAVDLAHELRKKGIDVRFAAGHRTEKKIIAPFKLEKLFEIKNKYARKLGFDYLNLLSATKLVFIVRRYEPDVVHFHGVYGISSLLVRLASRNTPTFVTFHDTWFIFYDPPKRRRGAKYTNYKFMLPVGWLHFLTNQFFLRHATIIVPSRWIEKACRRVGLKNKFLHIPHGVWSFPPQTSYENKLLWVGAIVEEKGLQDVLPSMAVVAHRNAWGVTVIGDGPDRSATHSLCPEVTFMGWGNVDEYFNTGSILVISSRVEETGPLVLLEGMSYGLCVVGANRGGIKEKIDDAKTGFLYNSRSQLEEILEFLISDRSEIKRVGANARLAVQKNYSWNLCARRHLKAYTESSIDL